MAAQIPFYSNQDRTSGKERRTCIMAVPHNFVTYISQRIYICYKKGVRASIQYSAWESSRVIRLP